MAPEVHIHVHESSSPEVTAQLAQTLSALQGLTLLAGRILQGVTMGMTKAELEAALDSIKSTLATVASNVTTINTAAQGLTADIASLKAMIETGATGDLSARVTDILNAAQGLATSTQASADALTALDAQTTPDSGEGGTGGGTGGTGGGEGTGGTGSGGGGEETGGGTGGGEEGGGSGSGGEEGGGSTPSPSGPPSHG